MQYGLIGKSLAHSFSKSFFEEKFSKLGLEDFSYKNFELSDIEDFPRIWKENALLKGINVTMPYKEKIVDYLDEISEEATGIGSVNVVKMQENGRLKGFNTDAYGFRKSLKPLLESHHQKALVLGTGGASKAVLFVLKELGIGVKSVSRKPRDEQISYSEASHLLNDFYLVINTTPLGTFPYLNTKPDLDYHDIGRKHLFYDLIYNPSETLFLQTAKGQGAKTKNGLEMLHLQAEKSWQIWQE